MANVAVSTGNAATISRFEASAVQQKMGMRKYPMPGRAQLQYRRCEIDA